MIKAFIVDDEEHNRDVLKMLLNKHSPNVEIIGEANNVNDAYVMIYNLKPQLVFLDVKMPIRNGFDLLKLFKKIKFEVIFVTAYDEFAINAFELNAIGYILKPIDYVLLTKTINKAELIINSNKQEGVIADFI
ncbi:MAG: response regulator [Bacteroidetes bacterium]|nr:response regulator [Bacteroidota bacterium]